MRYINTLGCAVLAVGVLAGAPRVAAAQETAPQADACPAGKSLQGDLGIAGFSCNCTYYEGADGERYWLFRSEPEVIEVRENSVASGKLRGGDVITAIDGMLITTREAGRRFANVRPGERVTLTLRRGDSWSKFTLVAGGRCERAVPAPAAPPTPPTAPRTEAPPREPRAARPPTAREAPSPVPAAVPRPARLPRPPEGVFPSGWFGFGISCDCTVHAATADAPPVWEFREPPEIYSVEPGSPAERAGLKRGDRLIEIDGVPLVDEAGGRRFGAVKAGQAVRFVYRRGGERGAVSITADERVVPSATRAVVPDLLRYVGTVGNVEIEVRGASSVIVSELESGAELEIVTRDARIRIRKAQE